MTGVYNALVEDALPAALFNNQTGAEQYFIKTKKKLGHLAIALFALASAIIALAGYYYFFDNPESFRGSYYRSHGSVFSIVISFLCGLFGILCALFGFRVSLMRKGRCIFITYFVLTIMTAVVTGFATLFSLTEHWQSSLLETGICLLLRLSLLIVAVVSSAMVCSIWGRMGGCCGSGSEPPVIYIQTTATTDEISSDTKHVMFVPMRRS